MRVIETIMTSYFANEPTQFNISLCVGQLGNRLSR